MDLHEELLKLEEGFWKKGRAYFREHLSKDALMVLPSPAGVMTRAMTLRSIDESSRWAELTMREAQVLSLSETVAVLTYHATGRREAVGPRYTARCSSVYLQDEGRWKLALHQQTPD